MNRAITPSETGWRTSRAGHEFSFNRDFVVETGKKVAPKARKALQKPNP